MKIELEVEKASVLLTDGQDLVLLSLKAPTPYPEMRYPAVAEIKTRYGYGVEWCRLVFNIEPVVTSVRSDRFK